MMNYRKHTYMAYLFILITVVLTHNFSDIVIATNWVGFQMGFHICWVKQVQLTNTRCMPYSAVRLPNRREILIDNI